MAQALQMGDEGHNRNRAGTSLLFRELAPAVVRATDDRETAARVLEFIHGNDHFFLNLSMPMAKCMLLAAEGEPLSSLVTVMARNGTDFGIQLASMPGRWFTGPGPDGARASTSPASPPPTPTPTSATAPSPRRPASAASPWPPRRPSCSSSAAAPRTPSRPPAPWAASPLGANSGFAIPALGFAGTPTGIDLRHVEERNLLPPINTGIAHREPGVGQVGAGLVNPPWEASTPPSRRSPNTSAPRPAPPRA